MRVKYIGTFAAFGAAVLASMTTPLAATNSERDRPVVLELFTSQACSSCAGAVDYFRELAARTDIVAIGWHVDYWDKLETKNGKWRDPYANPMCGERQRVYNKRIRNKSSIYTPQLIINGVIESVGSAREQISQRINDARVKHDMASVSASRKDGKVIFEIGPTPMGGEAFLVSFLREKTTEVKQGENAGMWFIEANVATNLAPQGRIGAVGGVISAEVPEPGEDCALFVQEPGQGRMLAAAYCAE